MGIVALFAISSIWVGYALATLVQQRSRGRITSPWTRRPSLKTKALILGGALSLGIMVVFIPAAYGEIRESDTSRPTHIPDPVPPVNLEVAGRWPFFGFPFAVTAGKIDGTPYAFLGVGSSETGILIVDISAPVNPTQVGEMLIPKRGANNPAGKRPVLGGKSSVRSRRNRASYRGCFHPEAAEGLGIPGIPRGPAFSPSYLRRRRHGADGCGKLRRLYSRCGRSCQPQAGRKPGDPRPQWWSSRFHRKRVFTGRPGRTCFTQEHQNPEDTGPHIRRRYPGGPCFRGCRAGGPQGCTYFQPFIAHGGRSPGRRKLCGGCGRQWAACFHRRRR